MPDFRRVHCQVCGGHASKVGAISWRGKCRDCGKRLQNENLDQLVTMTNPGRDRWRRGMLASVYPELLDRLPPPP